MKKLAGIFAILFVLTSCQEQQKIAFVDSNKVFQDYQERIEAENNYKLKQEAFKKKTDSINRAYQIEVTPIQSKYAGLSPEQLQKNPEVAKFQQKWQMIDQEIKMQEQVIQKMLQSESDSITAHINTFIKDFAKTNKYAYVLGKNNANSVMFGEEKSDVTEKVIEELNAFYKNTKSETTEATTKE